MPITIEFTVKNGDQSFKEDMIFLPPEHPNITNPVADKRATLQLGIILITAPLATIVQVTQEILDKVGRGELSEAFLAAAHAND
jgi:hypothetical protein